MDRLVEWQYRANGRLIIRYCCDYVSIGLIVQQNYVLVLRLSVLYLFYADEAMMSWFKTCLIAIYWTFKNVSDNKQQEKEKE